MWILIFYLSFGFGTGATGGPGVIDNFRTEAACVAASKQLEATYKSKYDGGHCIKIEK